MNVANSAASSWRDALIKSIGASAVPTALTRQNTVIYGNAAFAKLYGNVVGKQADSLFQAENADFFRWLTQAGRVESDQTLLTIAQGRAAGKEALVQVWPLAGDIGLLSINLDYSMQRIADLDELTRLPNRRKANLLLQIEQARVRRGGGFCLALGDIDKFKNINDTHGHQVGDKVLQHVAAVLQKGVREIDWVARWGGEEFLMFINGADLETGMQPMNRIYKMLNAAPFTGAGAAHSFPVTMSFGIVSSDNSPDVETMIHKADTLMYDAKHTGRNRIILEQSGKKIWLADNILQAAEDGDISPVFFPVVNRAGKTVAVKIEHTIRGAGAAEVKKILFTAEQLRLRPQTDFALLQKTAAVLPAKSSAPFFFPLSDALLSARRAEVLAFFKKFPYLHAGVSASRNLSAKNRSLLQKNNIPLALLDFAPPCEPQDLLATLAGARYAFLPAAAAEAAAGLPKKVMCFAAGKTSNPAFAGVLSAKKISRL